MPNMKTVTVLVMVVVGALTAPQRQETPSRRGSDDQVTDPPGRQVTGSGRQFGAQLGAGEPQDQGTESERQFDTQEFHVPQPLLPQQPYNFRFNIDDEIRGVRFAHVGQGNELGHVQGSYTYFRPDGILQTVNYVANETGFHPEIREEPAPQEVHVINPNGKFRFTVLLPYAEEYGAEVTAEELRQYQLQAAQQEGLIITQGGA